MVTDEDESVLRVIEEIERLKRSLKEMSQVATDLGWRGDELRVRAEKAEKENIRLRALHDAWHDLCDRYADREEQAEAEIAKLRLDKVRIDWLDANMTLGDRLARYANDDPEDPGDHRGAIDAAMGSSD